MEDNKLMVSMKHKNKLRLGICLCVLLCLIVIWLTRGTGFADSSFTTQEEQNVERTDRISLNDIRFANFKDEDWLDNDYIRCLRQYLDDYNSGKIEDEFLDPYKKKLQGQFIIGDIKPNTFGGATIYFTLIESPDDIFSAWVYSVVDEFTGTVTDYQVRSVTLEEMKSGATKEQLIQISKDHPEMKLW